MRHHSRPIPLLFCFFFLMLFAAVQLLSSQNKEQRTPFHLKAQAYSRVEPMSEVEVYNISKNRLAEEHNQVQLYKVKINKKTRNM